VSEPLPTLNARLFVALQRLLPQHGLSHLMHGLARVRRVPVKNALIGSFVRHYRPDLSEAVESDPRAYASFNEFFTRALRPGARPLDADPAAVLSPVDGTISQIGYLDGERIVQAKGHTYGLGALLAGEARWTERLAGGGFATLYLAPYNYHRIHVPLDATLQAAWYVPGRLFSVNAATAAAVPDLFASNERVVCLLEGRTPAQRPLSFAMVLIGALFVGSIATVWHGEVTPGPHRAGALSLDAIRAPRALARGAEMGRFNMGSTVIMVFPRDSLEWLAALAPGTAIRVGQSLARLREMP
jgi:phosphatidylserine decarboxylase